MQVSVESPSKTKRQMTVIVPAETVDQVYKTRLQKLSKTVKMDGFRPGKVPVEKIQRQYGDSLHEETLQEVIQSSLYNALAQEKLHPVSQPQINPKNALLGQPLEYVAVFDIAPQIDQVVFNADQIEKRVAVIDEADIDRVIEHLRQQHATWKPITTPAELNDKAVIDFAGSLDKIAFEGGTAKDYPIVLGSKTMIPGFEEQIVGLKAGTETEINVTFPENYFSKNVAGKVVQFAITVKKVLRPEYPTLDESLIKKLGGRSGKLDDLRNEIRKNLERELQRVIQAELKEKVLEILIKQNPITDIPQAMLDREAARIHDYMHPQHHGHAHEHTAQEQAVFATAAQRNLTVGLLLGHLIKQHQIVATREKISEHVATLASVYEDTEAATKWLLQDKQSRAEIEMHVLENQLIAKLLESVKIKEVSVSYNELMNKGMKQDG
ncbi:hypothetical protein AYO45_04885 [Gammaproteobacteria bacterium SCGC AG-212-F23]|nr:hypothetical protein AYO45_04885 [Gammaproteobacteria bacterium SCGC AG-212-F23]